MYIAQQGLQDSILHWCLVVIPRGMTTPFSRVKQAAVENLSSSRAVLHNRIILHLLLALIVFRNIMIMINVTPCTLLTNRKEVEMEKLHSQTKLEKYIFCILYLFCNHWLADYPFFLKHIFFKCYTDFKHTRNNG